MNFPKIFPTLPPVAASLSDTFLLWAFGIIVCLFGLVSALLLFHWITYGRRNFTIFVAQVLYWGVSGALLMVMLIAVQNY